MEFETGEGSGVAVDAFGAVVGATDGVGADGDLVGRAGVDVGYQVTLG